MMHRMWLSIRLGQWWCCPAAGIRQQDRGQILGLSMGGDDPGMRAAVHNVKLHLIQLAGESLEEGVEGGGIRREGDREWERNVGRRVWV